MSPQYSFLLIISITPKLFQITAPSISDRNCQLALTSSADTLSDAAQDLEKVWRPLVQDTKNKQIGDQLTRDLDLLNNELEVLKKTCQDNSGMIFFKELLYRFFGII